VTLTFGLAQAIARTLLEGKFLSRDDKGLFIEYDKITMSLAPVPGAQHIEFWRGAEKLGGFDVDGMDRRNVLSVTGIEGRMRVKFE